MNTELIELPPNWKWTTMVEIADVVGGGTPKTNDPANYESGTIPWITPADLSGYTAKHITHGARFITKKGLEESSAKMMPAGAVLFTSRAPIGYVAIASNPVCTNQGFKSFVLKDGILPDYVYWWLKGSKDLAESMASGTTFLELSGAKAKQLPIPVAPLDQQKRIVAEIEKQFSRLDEAVANLKRVKANLKRYKAAVLKAAVEGRLVETEAELAQKKTPSPLGGEGRGEGGRYETGEQLLKRILGERRKKWEEAELAKMKEKGKTAKDDKWKKKYKEPAAPDTTGLPELPEGWVWATVDQLAEKITDGEHISPNVLPSGVPLLSAKDVRDFGVVFDDAKYVSPDDAIKFRGRCDPDRGDILIVSRGATVGRACRVNVDQNFCLMGSVILMKLHKLLESNYALSALKAGFFLTRLTAVSGSTAQQAIYIRDIRPLPLPLPPFVEQTRIVAEVDRRLSLIREVEAQIGVNLKRSDRLRQALLASAFQGKLPSANTRQGRLHEQSLTRLDQIS